MFLFSVKFFTIISGLFVIISQSVCTKKFQGTDIFSLASCASTNFSHGVRYSRMILPNEYTDKLKVTCSRTCNKIPNSNVENLFLVKQTKILICGQ